MIEDNVKNKHFRLDLNTKIRKGSRRMTKVALSTRNHKNNRVKILVILSNAKRENLAPNLMEKKNGNLIK